MTAPRPVTMWKAADGSMHQSAERATAHDALVAEIRAALSFLAQPPAPWGDMTPAEAAWRSRYDEGRDYLQQSPFDLERSRSALVALLRKHHPDLLGAGGSCNPWFVCRALCDSDSLLYGPCCRLFFGMDDQAREWAQSAYAMRAGAVKWRATR